MRNKLIFALLLPAVLLICLNCAIGTQVASAFTSDSDPELVGDAIPFALKISEAMFTKRPNQMIQTGSMFVMYANAFVQGPAEFLPRSQFEEKQAAAERAKKLYLRGLEFLYGGLEKKYKGFDGAFQNGNPDAPLGTLPKILKKMKKADVPGLYWAAAAGISAFSVNPFDMDLGTRVPEFLALMNRAYELDPGFNNGALDDFFVIFHASVPESIGGDRSKVENHYRLALERSGGLLASPYVSYAQSVSIPAQDYDTFKSCLEKALAIDPDKDPANRLVNVINQRKARHLLDNAALHFIDFGNDWDDEDW